MYMKTDLLCLYVKPGRAGVGRDFSSWHSIFVLETGSQISWSVIGLTM